MFYFPPTLRIQRRRSTRPMSLKGATTHVLAASRLHNAVRGAGRYQSLSLFLSLRSITFFVFTLAESSQRAAWHQVKQPCLSRFASSPLSVILTAACRILQLVDVSFPPNLAGSCARLDAPLSNKRLERSDDMRDAIKSVCTRVLSLARFTPSVS